MKYLKYDAFEKHLKEASPKHFSPLYFVVAKDDFLRRTYMQKIASSLQATNPSAISAQSFDGEQHPFESVRAALNTPSLFSPKQILIIHGIEKFSKPDLEKLLSSKNWQDNSFLILGATALISTSKLYKQIETLGIILDMPEEKPWVKEKSLQDWVVKIALENKKHLSPSTALSLIKQVGSDYALLFNELQKLACFVGERNEISLADLKAISPQLSQETIWQLGEALFKREISLALESSKKMLEGGLAFLVLLRQLRNQFQTELTVCDILASGGSREEITNRFAHMKGNILERHIKMAQEYGMKHLQAGILAIDQAELESKNSSADPLFLNERLMIKLGS